MLVIVIVIRSYGSITLYCEISFILAKANKDRTFEYMSRNETIPEKLFHEVFPTSRALFLVHFFFWRFDIYTALKTD